MKDRGIYHGQHDRDTCAIPSPVGEETVTLTRPYAVTFAPAELVD